MKKKLVLFSLLLIVACDNGDYRKGKRSMEGGNQDIAVLHFSKVPSDDEKYNESLVIMNEYFQSNIEIRKQLLLKKDDKFWDYHPTISTSELSNNWNGFSYQLLKDKLSSIIVEKSENPQILYGSDDVISYTSMFGNDVMSAITGGSSLADQFNFPGVRTYLNFRYDGTGAIVSIFKGLGDKWNRIKEEKFKWVVNLDNIEFKIDSPENKVMGGKWEYHTTYYSEYFITNRGKIKVEDFLNNSTKKTFNQKDKQTFYDFVGEVKTDFIKNITPTNISEWTSSPLMNSGVVRDSLIFLAN
jgi:hypothetical protein